MYGMIHRGIREMVIEKASEQTWQQLMLEQGVGPTQFVSLNLYDDALTVRLIAAAAEVLQLSMDEAMVEFGRYWVRYAEHGSYGDIMNFTGQDLVGFIGNLDRMHQAVLLAMPEAKVPSFRLAAQGEGWVEVHYQSDREGLQPFVCGLFEGLLARFSLSGTVEVAPANTNAQAFVIRFGGE